MTSNYQNVELYKGNKATNPKILNAEILNPENSGQAVISIFKLNFLDFS